MGFWDFLKRKKKSEHQAPQPKEMIKIMAQESRKEKFRHNRHYITKTAVSCLVCRIPLRRHFHDFAGIKYTCSKICRMMLRGGKTNRHLLKMLYEKKEELWTQRQIYLAQTRGLIKLKPKKKLPQ